MRRVVMVVSVRIDREKDGLYRFLEKEWRRCTDSQAKSRLCSRGHNKMVAVKGSRWFLFLIFYYCRLDFLGLGEHLPSISRGFAYLQRVYSSLPLVMIARKVKFNINYDI